ncbi:DUF2971 domain-containing protein [Cellvibrio sp. UBA7661]|uniref:DUF2971 domain-containing protein n=1 Tax=Cellvibrio sp. UBA7661 TaxID=1946311 RepID=UPI002F351278
MKLYRFEKNEEERLNSIKNGNIFISSPKSFNDLDDCSLNSIYSTNRKNMEAALHALYESEDDFPYGQIVFKLLKKFLDNEAPDKDQPTAQKNKETLAQKIYDPIRNETGIYCFFSGAPLHPLMWAHYANNHTGFCIEYNFEDQTRETPLYEVDYSTKSVQLSIDELLLCPQQAFTRLLTTKSSEWQYEKEFRLIYLNAVPSYKNGTTIQRPKTIIPSKLITGDKFCYAMNEKLIKSLNIEIVEYKKFVADQKKQLNKDRP